MPFPMKSVSIWRHVLIILVLVMSVTVSSKAQAVQIGQHYAGGIVFYVDESGQHGLVAASSDISGMYNWRNAKKACTAYNVTIGDQTYDDWFLPSKDELNELYKNKDAVGGFANHYSSIPAIYWSSSERDTDRIWFQDFTDGGQFYINKFFFRRVRAVRAF